MVAETQDGKHSVRMPEDSASTYCGCVRGDFSCKAKLGGFIGNFEFNMDFSSNSDRTASFSSCNIRAVASLYRP